MAGLLPGDPSHHGMFEVGPYKIPQENPDEGGGRWYLLRKEIEENSPSKHDGIDLKKETYLRKSYCTFLQDLGMRLKVPQVTIATAIIFCHRFFLRQSHAKNDRRTIATVCMFLAGKVEETPRPLKDVILVSYEIIHKKDPAATQRIKQKEVYEQQKELILLGERAVLATLGFDLNVHHPYKPLVEAIKKFKVAQNALAQVAWNFVNDGLRTSLCLQFMPHHIAAGAIFLAAKFLKVKLPSDGDKVWWQEFDVTPRQLEEVSNQMLELYEQNRVPPSQGSEIESSIGASGAIHRALLPKPQTEEHATSKPGGTLKLTSSSRPVSDQSHAIEPHPGPALRNSSNEIDYKPDIKPHDPEPENIGEAQNHHTSLRIEAEEEKNEDSKDFVVGIKRIDKDKVKAALEKRRKSRADVARKTDVMDDDDLIERELEDGIELGAVKREKSSYDNIEEEGEVSAFDDSSRNHNPRKRKAAGSPIPEGRGHMPPVPQHQDRNRSRHGYLDKRNVQENHV